MLIEVLPASDPNKQTYEKFVHDNMLSMVQHAKTSSGEYGAYWQGPVGRYYSYIVAAYDNPTQSIAATASDSLLCL